MSLIRGVIPEWVNKTFSGDGYGYGYGYGYGDGDGSGDGYGSGSGSGYGSGYGYGSGSGSGSGSGYGSGYGDGDGSGYGSGYGYGDGYGDGYGSGYGSGYGYWFTIFEMSKSSWNKEQISRFNDLSASASTLAFWKSDKKGLPSNGGLAPLPAYVGKIEEISGPLEICTKHALHATMDPGKWKGERLWVVALFGEVQQQNDKFGALKREIIAEIKI